VVEGNDDRFAITCILAGRHAAAFSLLRQRRIKLGFLPGQVLQLGPGGGELCFPLVNLLINIRLRLIVRRNGGQQLRKLPGQPVNFIQLLA